MVASPRLMSAIGYCPRMTTREDEKCFLGSKYIEEAKKRSYPCWGAKPTSSVIDCPWRATFDRHDGVK